MGATYRASVVTIWSRHPVEPIETSDGARTAAVRVRPESEEPFVIVARCSHGSEADGKDRPSATAFQASLDVQAQDGCASGVTTRRTSCSCLVTSIKPW